MTKQGKVFVSLGIFLAMWIVVWYLDGTLADNQPPPQQAESTHTLQIHAHSPSFGPREYIRIRKAD